MLRYFLEFSVFLGLFWLFYKLFLEKEHFFTANRMVILLAPIIAAFLPLFSLSALVNVIPEQIQNIQLLPVYLGKQVLAVGTQPVSANSHFLIFLAENYIWVAYGVGMLIASLLFILKYRRLYELKRKSIKNEQSELPYFIVKDSRVAFTFFNQLFLGDGLSKSEQNLVLQHEMVHIRQRHSWDLLFYELLRIIFWFHPIVYLFQRELSLVHEYIADDYTATKLTKQAYFNQLLNATFGTQNLSFINQIFNHSLIKKRIVMLQKSKSKSIFKLKYSLFIPLILGMMLYISCSQSKEASQLEKLNTAEMPISPAPPTPPSPPEIEEIPFSVVEQTPVFPGCENLESNEEKKMCFSNKINEFVSKNFRVKALEQYAESGRNKIYARFVINKEGVIENINVRSKSPQLEAEAMRVVGLLPKMKPGIDKGKPINIAYALPIIFEVNNKKEDTKNE